MFDTLGERLGVIFKRFKRYGILSEANIKEALRDVRIALLEADVNYKVVKDFIESVKVKAMGKDVLEGLTPGQQFIKIVKEGLILLLGDKTTGLDLRGRAPIPIMLVGLQGSGKTTTVAKLAKHLKGKGRKPLLVPADVYRPAAILQIKKLGSDIKVDVFEGDGLSTPQDICREALKQVGYDTILVDTAGRLHIDEDLMEELRQLKGILMPKEILFVADSMTGQDAVNMARGFNDALDISGVILTKLDGDTRGGAALSMKTVTGRPIKFIGTGEGLDTLEPFYPDRMASRILGMGDVLTLIEKAQATIDEKRAKELETRFRKNSFTLEDFKEGLCSLKRMGPLEGLLNMIPGFKDIQRTYGITPDEKDLMRVEAIINSMTRKERLYPHILNASRRRRIAKGSGTTVQDVNRLIKQYLQTREMMKRLTRVSPGGFSTSHLPLSPNVSRRG